MANLIERKLPKPIRDQMRTLIAAALGLFLGLQYNDYFSELFQYILPSTDTLLGKTIIIISLTVAVVYTTVLIEKALDGK
jgi:hypothetical protein